MTASDGSARPMLATLTASRAPRPVWPIQSPTGSAIARAMQRARSPRSRRVRPCRIGMPFGPGQLAGSGSQAIEPVPLPLDHELLRRSAPAPTPPEVHGVSRRWSRTNRTSTTIASDDRGHRADADLGREVGGVALEDEEAEAAERVAEGRRDRHEADRRDASPGAARPRPAARPAAAPRAEALRGAL